MTVLEKEALWNGTGAAAVDMESGAATKSQKITDYPSQYRE